MTSSSVCQLLQLDEHVWLSHASSVGEFISSYHCHSHRAGFLQFVLVMEHLCSALGPVMLNFWKQSLQPFIQMPARSKIKTPSLGFLQEGADVYLPLQPCPHLQEMSESIPDALHMVCWQTVLTRCSESYSLKHIVTSLGIRSCFTHRKYDSIWTVNIPLTPSVCLSTSLRQRVSAWFAPQSTDCSVSSFKFSNTPQSSKYTHGNLQFKGWSDFLHYK